MVNYGFQRYSISRSLSSRGIETEKVDLHAHIDRRLSLGENQENISRMFGLYESSDTRRVKQKIASRRPRQVRRSEREGEYYQIGSSHKEIDKRMNAKAPGKRRSKSGKTYTERRKNRSDRPGWGV
jgi:hypothetical protein